MWENVFNSRDLKNANRSKALTFKNLRILSKVENKNLLMTPGLVERYFEPLPDEELTEELHKIEKSAPQFQIRVSAQKFSENLDEKLYLSGFFVDVPKFWMILSGDDLKAFFENKLRWRIQNELVKEEILCFEPCIPMFYENWLGSQRNLSTVLQILT